MANLGNEEEEHAPEYFEDDGDDEAWSDCVEYIGLGGFIVQAWLLYLF